MFASVRKFDVGDDDIRVLEVGENLAGCGGYGVRVCSHVATVLCLFVYGVDVLVTDCGVVGVVVVFGDEGASDAKCFLGCFVVLVDVGAPR